MESDYSKLKNIFQKLKQKLDFELPEDIKQKIILEYPDNVEEKILEKKKEIFNQNKKEGYILLSRVSIIYNFNYSLLEQFIKNFDELTELEEIDKKYAEINTDDTTLVYYNRKASKIEHIYYIYIYHYYKNKLEGNEAILPDLLIKINKLKNLVRTGVTFDEEYIITDAFQFVDRVAHNIRLNTNYVNELKNVFLNGGNIKEDYSEYIVSLPEFNNFIYNRIKLNGLYQGKYAFIPNRKFREEVNLNTGDVYNFMGQNITADKNMIIYPIKRFSKLMLIPKYVLSSYNRNFLGLNMQKINLIKRLNEIESSHNYFKKLLFTMFVDSLLLIISDISVMLEKRNIGLIISGGFAYRKYNHSYITEDIDIILGDLVGNNVSIKPLENYREVFALIIEYFNNIKMKYLTPDMIKRIMNKFFKDLNNLGINLNLFPNIKSFYDQFKLNNIDLDFVLSVPPHNDKIIKFTIINLGLRNAFIDININDKVKAISTLNIIKQIGIGFVEQKLIEFQNNIDQLYAFFEYDINNTFYQINEEKNIIYDSNNKLRVVKLEYILHEKNYLINKISNNQLFGVIDTSLSEDLIYNDKQRFLEKFNKLILTHEQYQLFYSLYPNTLQILNFNNFIG
jgi:hypothetical protein